MFDEIRYIDGQAYRVQSDGFTELWSALPDETTQPMQRCIGEFPPDFWKQN